MKAWGILCCLLIFACGTQEVQTVAVDDELDQFFLREGDFAASHILIAFQGARNADNSVKRTSAEAKAKADSILAEVQAHPERFAELARKESDGSSAALNGCLGAWQAGEFLSEIEHAVAGLEEGQLLGHVLKTSYGYHVLRRDPLRVKHFCADGFVISFKSLPQNGQLNLRNRQQAEELAKTIKKQLNKENFDELAKRYNDLGKDGPSFMGVVCDGVLWPPKALELLQSLKYGEVAGPVELPSGLAFLRREKVIPYAGASILVAWQGADGAKPEISRSKNEAYERALTLIQRLNQDPSGFAELAKSESDGPTASVGGDMKTWFRGTMDVDFRDGFEKLEIGQISATPVATRFGYYIILRKQPTG